MKQLINQKEISDLLGIELTSTYRLIRQNENFPTHVKKTKKGTFFNRTDVVLWAVRHQKGFCNALAQQAIRGQCWIINKQRA